MILKKITITNFRNFDNFVFCFSPSLTIIIGKNSIGKTNLLEAVYFSLKSRGFREQKEEELINYDKIKADVQIELAEQKEETKLKINIEKNDPPASGVVKNCFVNKIRKKSYQYLLESLPVVIFSPNFVYVIEGEPGERRSYFDIIIAIFDIEYKKRLVNYESALRKRNKILELEKNIEKLKEDLEFWDDYLIEQANYIAMKRQELIDFFNKHRQVDSKNFSIDYVKNEFSRETLDKTFKKQLILKKTLIGPQRDDFIINIKTPSGFKNVHKFGSRSEQRLALFWLVLNEINLYQEILKKRPLVLLDDVFSELDITNKELVLKLIKKYQTVITTTEENILSLVDMPHTIINL